jgi:hypothetical protein
MILAMEKPTIYDNFGNNEEPLPESGPKKQKKEKCNCILISKLIFQMTTNMQICVN